MTGDVSYQRFSAAAELQRLVENDLAVLLSERFEWPAAGRRRGRGVAGRGGAGAGDAACGPRR